MIFNIITYTHPFCSFNKKTPKNEYTRNQPIHFSMIPKIQIFEKKIFSKSEILKIRMPKKMTPKS